MVLILALSTHDGVFAAIMMGARIDTSSCPLMSAQYLRHACTTSPLAYWYKTAWQTPGLHLSSSTTLVEPHRSTVSFASEDPIQCLHRCTRPRKHGNALSTSALVGWLGPLPPIVGKSTCPKMAAAANQIAHIRTRSRLPKAPPHCPLTTR